jgi:hypothetical protein
LALEWKKLALPFLRYFKRNQPSAEVLPKLSTLSLNFDLVVSVAVTLQHNDGVKAYMWVCILEYPI